MRMAEGLTLNPSRLFGRAQDLHIMGLWKDHWSWSWKFRVVEVTAVQ